MQYRDGARLDSRFLIEQTVCGSELIAQHPLWYPVVERLLGDAQLLFGKFQHTRLLGFAQVVQDFDCSSFCCR